jgi:multicomponent K+:H+ antiporter subunit G
MFFTYYTRGHISINELLITLFLVITAPVTAHILAKVAMHHRVKVMERTRNQHLIESARMQLPTKPESEKSSADS